MALAFALFWFLQVLSLCAAEFVQLSALPYNFTLAAWNETLPNANSTGVPLVLGQDGTIRKKNAFLTYRLIRDSRCNRRDDPPCNLGQQYL